KKNGDAVRKGDVLVTLETDKVSNELEADADGVLEILVSEGEEVAIGTVIARIAGGSVAPREETPASAKPAAAATSSPAAGKVIDVKVPAAGDSITTANVARWHKSDGSAVNKGDALVTLETDKVSNELEAEESGVLKILVPEGDEVAIGTVVARIVVGESGATPAPAPAPTTRAAAPDPKPAAAPEAAPASQETARQKP